MCALFNGSGRRHGVNNSGIALTSGLRAHQGESQGHGQTPSQGQGQILCLGQHCRAQHLPEVQSAQSKAIGLRTVPQLHSKSITARLGVSVSMCLFQKQPRCITIPRETFITVGMQNPAALQLRPSMAVRQVVQHRSGPLRRSMVLVSASVLVGHLKLEEQLVLARLLLVQ